MLSPTATSFLSQANGTDLTQPLGTRIAQIGSPEAVTQPTPNLLQKILGEREVVHDPSTDKTNPTRLLSAFANNETGGLKTDPYVFSQPSGIKAYGKALGKYQVTESELKQFAQEYIGKPVTPNQFLSSPALQDAYMTGKIKKLQNEGFGDAAILALHNKGMSGKTDPDVIKEKIAHAQAYVDKGLNFINGKQQ